MTSGFRDISGVDLDNIFTLRADIDPSANLTGYLTSDGKDLALRYYPFQTGMTPVNETKFTTLVSGTRTDLRNVFAPQPMWYNVGSGVTGNVAINGGTKINVVCAVDASNIYVAGNFTSAGGVSVNNIAKWNGATWSSLGFPLFSNTVETNYMCIAAIAGSNVFLSSTTRNTSTGKNPPFIHMYNFSTWASVPNVGIAMIGSNTESADIYSMCLLNATTLFVGGSFNTTQGLAKYDINTSTWTQIGAGFFKPGSYRKIAWAMAKLSSTQIVVGGNFDQAGGTNFDGIAVYNNTNGQWTQFIAAYTSFGTINSISVVSPTVAFVGSNLGFFRVNDAGTGWVNTGVTTGWSSNQVSSVCAVNSSNVYFSGSFNTAPYKYVAKWNGTSAVRLGSGVNSVVSSIAGTGTRNVYFGGSFTAVSNLSGDLSANYIAKWA